MLPLGKMRPHHAGNRVAVGEAKPREPNRLRLQDQLFRMRGAAQEREIRRAGKFDIARDAAAGFHVAPSTHLSVRSAPKERVSKDEVARFGASWFETRGFATLLTMRIWKFFTRTLRARTSREIVPAANPPLTCCGRARHGTARTAVRLCPRRGNNRAPNFSPRPRSTMRLRYAQALPR